MKECRDIVRELIAMMESGAFAVEGFKNEFGTYDYIAFNYGLSYDGIVFRIDGQVLDVQLTGKEDKSLNKAFTNLIDGYIINEDSWDGFRAIEKHLGY